MRHILWALVAASLLVSFPASAHKASDSYLTLTIEDGRIGGRWDISLRDLERAIGVDSDGNGRITWGELETGREAIAAYALAHLRIGPAESPCALAETDQQVTRHSDGAYAVLSFTADCAHPPDPLPIAYRLFFDLDPQHRGLLEIRAEAVSRSAVFSPETSLQTIAIEGGTGLSAFTVHLREGLWHIWSGFDHLLFLFTLLLPAALRRDTGRWQALESWQDALGPLIKVVTAFTVAHSLTLGAAVLGFAALPSRLVESVIAASIIVAAANNVWPIVTRRLWLLAFGFGLVHGFGFAGVLTGLDLSGASLATALLGFNLGVELGQLAIVALVLPPLFVLSRARPFARFVLPLGSLAVSLVAALWLAERALDMTLWVS